MSPDPKFVSAFSLITGDDVVQQTFERLTAPDRVVGMGGGSFTLKISAFKPVDLGAVVDHYRVQVFASIADQVVQLNKRRDLDLVAKLAAKNKENHKSCATN